MVKFRPKIVTNYMFISGAKSPKPETQSASCIGQFYLLELDLKSPPKQKLRLSLNFSLHVHERKRACELTARWALEVGSLNWNRQAVNTLGVPTPNSPNTPFLIDSLWRLAATFVERDGMRVCVCESCVLFSGWVGYVQQRAFIFFVGNLCVTNHNHVCNATASYFGDFQATLFWRFGCYFLPDAAISLLNPK